VGNAANLVESLDVKSLVAPQTLTADVLSAAFDTLGYEGAMKVAFITAAPSTGDTLDVTVQSSDTSGGTYAVVDGGTFAQLTDASTGAALAPSLNIDRRKCKRFVKVNLDVGGASISFAFGGALFMGAKKYQA